MVKRQRTPHFIMGLGDGHVGRENSNTNQQAQQRVGAGLLRHPTNNKIHNTGVAGTDDIFQVTKHVRRTNNNNKDSNNNNGNPNHYRLRPAAAATPNERLVRMELMDDAGKGGSRWDMIFSSSTSGDGSGSANRENGGVVGGAFGVVVNPMRTAEQWQMSAFAIVGMIVFLSALFLHLVSDSTTSGSGSSHSHHHHHHHGTSNNKYPRRIHIARTKRKTSGTTRKKKFDEWSSDEEEYTDPDVNDMSDGQASTSTPIHNGVIVGGHHHQTAGSSTSVKPVLFYPYQPRHRKPSVNGQKETYAGTTTAASSSYSPSAAAAAADAGGGFHSRNYYLNPSNPRDGPVMMPSYHTPTSSSLKVRLSSPQQQQQQQQQQPSYHQNSSCSPAAGPSQSQAQQHPATLLQPKLSEQQQQQPTPKNMNAAASTSSPVVGKSPAQPQRGLLVATALDQQFVATGLESFQSDPPPSPPSNTNPLAAAAAADPQAAALTHHHNNNNNNKATTAAASTTTATMDIDEESQAQQQPISEASSNSLSPMSSSQNHPQSPAASSSSAAAAAAAAAGGGGGVNISPAVFNRQISYTNTDNNYQAYSSTSWDNINSFNSNISSSDNNNLLMMNESTHHASNVHNRGNVHPHRNSGTSSIGMMSPRREIDITDLETPRAGLTRRTVDVTMVHHQQQTGGGGGTPQAHGGRGGGGINLLAKNNSLTAKRQEQHQQQQPLLDGFGSINNNPNDPFYTLRLPSTQAMGMMPQPRPQPPNEQNENALPGVGGSIIQDEGIPLLPKLDPTGMGSAASGNFSTSAGGGGGGGGQNGSSIAAPQSIQIDALRLEQMEFGSAPHWQVRNPSPANAAANKPEVQIVPPQHNHPFGSSSELFAAQSVSSNTSDFEDDSAVETNEARKSIKHKRPNITDDTDAARSLQSSIKFKELKLEEVIGGGGFGQVWRAFWRGTPVAVKVLTGSAQAKHVSKAILEEFAAEINLLSGMRHPNICLYMGACVDPPNRAIITELAANGSLWDALRLPLNPPFSASDGFSRHTWPGHLYYPGKHGTPPTSTGVTMPPVAPVGSWPWLLVKHVACGAARGMAYLHSGEPPILHRDLKSANILLNESYTAKVCDFGLSRLKAQERSMTGNCGTVQWMAPEVLANQRYNEKADVFSYGIICTELLTRECPYEGMSAIQCALAVLNRDQRPEIPRFCPPQLRALIKACVKKNPDERPTFGQIIMALDAMP